MSDIPQLADGIEPPQESDKRNIWLAIPAYGATVTCATMKAIFYDMIELLLAGHTVKIFDEVGHADIYSLRAQIVAHFLADEAATDLVMIDDDVSWPRGAMIRLLGHDVDCVAGAYPKRDYPLQFMFRSAENYGEGDEIAVDPETQLVEVWGMPGGFMRLRRPLLERMWEAYKDEHGIYDRAVPGEFTVRMFDPLDWHDDEGRRRRLSEDYAFCERVRLQGGKVYMDPMFPMAHIGGHAFHGQVIQPKPQEQKDEAA